jgi:hypothetical protein
MQPVGAVIVGVKMKDVHLARRSGEELAAGQADDEKRENRSTVKRRLHDQIGVTRMIERRVTWS